MASIRAPGAPGLVGVEPEELGLGLDVLGAEVVDPAEDLVDVGLLVVPAGLEGEDRDVVRGRPSALASALGLGVVGRRRAAGAAGR